jgi:double-strand break repair protein AddB
MLTRQVSAALDRWNIIADASAGLPLQLSPPGRFLRHVAGLFSGRLTAEMLLTLLKHPLCHDAQGRGPHLLHTRDLELELRRNGPPFPDPASLEKFAVKHKIDPDWITWVSKTLCDQQVSGEIPLTDWVDRLRGLAEAIASGSQSDGSGTLWDMNAGKKALSVITSLADEAPYGGPMTARDFGDLLGALLAGEEVRDRDAALPGIMIWGTLEARVQGADLMILGGLNEGSWPEPAKPDPWLNRQMRDQAELLLPERRIGLSAHDFQQAIAAPAVWLTRAMRSDDAETVPSRWLNRMTNLLDGLPDQGGKAALAGMRARGQDWLDWAEALEHAPERPAAKRPSPRPPISARPRHLNVTEIKRLIRDPYAIYARRVLGLNPLNPLVQEPDALLRGNVIHEFLEDYIKATMDGSAELTADSFRAYARATLERLVPWPTARIMWLARLDRIADDFLTAEASRQRDGGPAAFEQKSTFTMHDPEFSLTGRADRIDQRADGTLRILDYKTGTPPSKAEQSKFDKQLLIEAAMAEENGFGDLPAAPVTDAAFLGVGSAYKEVPAPLLEEPPAKVLAELRDLLGAYLEPDQGFTSRRMLQKDTDVGDYDQLARFGEWDRSANPEPEDLT